MRCRFSHLKNSSAPSSASAVREVSDRRAVGVPGEAPGGGGDVVVGRKREICHEGDQNGGAATLPDFLRQWLAA